MIKSIKNFFKRKGKRFSEEKCWEIIKEQKPYLGTKLPLGVIKNIPIKDKALIKKYGKRATKKEIDFDCFFYNPNERTYTYKLDSRKKFCEYQLKEYSEWLKVYHIFVPRNF